VDKRMMCSIKQTCLCGAYSIGKKPFQLMIRLFFLFLFSNKLVFGALFHWKKPFQIMLRFFFYFFFQTNFSLGAYSTGKNLFRL
jgi:hypothetical protein